LLECTSKVGIPFGECGVVLGDGATGVVELVEIVKGCDLCGLGDLTSGDGQIGLGLDSAYQYSQACRAGNED
jgi:hypothetical protein